jgi:transposase-like protein
MIDQRSYPEQTQRDIVAKVLRGVETITEVFNRTGISRSSVYDWIELYGEEHDEEVLRRVAKNARRFTYRN